MKLYVRLLGVAGLALAIAAGAVFVSAGVASADGGPHGGYTSIGGTGGGLPDQCAGCHRAHTAVSNNLLISSSPYALCLTCHNGTGSKLDVIDGVKLSTEYPATVVSYAEGGSLRVSVAPAARLDVAAGANTAVYTVVVRNVSGAAQNGVSVACSETLTGNWAACAVSSASINVPGATGGVAGSASVTLTVNDGGGSPGVLVNGESLLTTVTVDAGPAVTVLTEVGGTLGGALLGGGFKYYEGIPVTSTHAADPADDALYPWGYGADTGATGSNLSNAMQCTSCHNSHGSSNYRILNDTINSKTVDLLAWYTGLTKDEGAPGLGGGAPADKYVQEYYGYNSSTSKVDTFCAACHTSYEKGATGAHKKHETDHSYSWSGNSNPETNPLPGFPVLRLSSDQAGGGAGNGNDDRLSCLTCHRAHGTNTAMGGWAVSSALGGLSDVEVSPAQTSASKSMLLITDNRGMCQACHQW